LERPELGIVTPHKLYSANDFHVEGDFCLFSWRWLYRGNDKFRVVVLDNPPPSKHAITPLEFRAHD